MTTHPWAKIREDLNMTQLEVADALNVTRQTVIRLEQGLFHAPSKEVLEELADLYSLEEVDLLGEYEDYVRETRLAFTEHHPNFEGLWVYTGKEHPLEAWRLMQGLSRMGFCKGLCLDYGPVADFEYNKQRATPEALILASKAIGWSLDPLERAVKEWRIKWR